MSQNRNKAVWDFIIRQYSTNEHLDTTETIRRALLKDTPWTELVESLGYGEGASIGDEMLIPNDVWINVEKNKEDSEDSDIARKRILTGKFPGQKFPGCSETKDYVIFIHHNVPLGGDNYVGSRSDSVKFYLTSRRTLRFMFEPLDNDTRGSEKKLIDYLHAVATKDDSEETYEKKLEIIEKIIEARDLYNLLVLWSERLALQRVISEIAIVKDLPYGVAGPIRNFTTPRINRPRINRRRRGGSRRRSMKRGTRTRRR
jgi:hypothetical protein